MAEIGNNFPYPLAPRPEGVPSQPQRQPQQQDDTTGRRSPAAPTRPAATATQGTAPLNALPNDDALQRLISRAQDAQVEGRTPQRGSIINLLV